MSNKTETHEYMERGTRYVVETTYLCCGCAAHVTEWEIRGDETRRYDREENLSECIA